MAFLKIIMGFLCLAVITIGRPVPLESATTQRHRHRHRHVRHTCRPASPRYNGDNRCQFDTEALITDFAWSERLNQQMISYDHHGNVIQRLQFWPIGCWSRIEKCDWSGTKCIPGTLKKWKYDGCNWRSGTCKPTRL